MFCRKQSTSTNQKFNQKRPVGPGSYGPQKSYGSGSQKGSQQNGSYSDTQNKRKKYDKNYQQKK